MNFAVEAEGPLVVMVLGELLSIVSPIWVMVVQREIVALAEVKEEEVQGRPGTWVRSNMSI